MCCNYYHKLMNVVGETQVFVCLAAVLCVVSGGYVAGPSAVVRAPHFDSAVIKSDRLGGNFAYSHAESHAYATINPVVENVVSPVGVSYSAHTVTAPVAVPAVAHVAAPAVAAYAAPAVAAYGAPAVAAYGAAPFAYGAHYYR